MKIKTITLRVKYWKLGTNYVDKIVEKIHRYIQNGDIIAVSEKAISMAIGNVVDESLVKPSKLAKFLSGLWTKTIWVNFLGNICRLKPKTLRNLKNYPEYEGACHKQVALRKVGFLQSLRHYSEGGIDASNLPYAYVSLPLKKPKKIAEKIKKKVLRETGKSISVVICDGDTTFSWRNLHLAPRKVSTPGLIHFGGISTFIIGRVFKLRSRQTPIAIAGEKINPDRLLWLTHLFHRLSKSGAGRTVWSMAENMGTGLTGITYEMLEAVPHYPISIIRIIN
jgi:F420-0:gamma-glutamyl ligase-like protein